MLTKLQRKTLIIPQIIAYALSLFVGIAILLTAIQLFVDLKPILKNEADVFGKQVSVISKKVSMLKTLNKKGIYFAEKEIDELKQQDFVKNVATFTSATFNVSASMDGIPQIGGLYTELFMESIPDKYLDVKTDEWRWYEERDFVPIIIPEDYIKLYNFGFAESQGLPVISKDMISHISFKVHISGNGKSKTLDSRIVGFTNNINSILVPLNFLEWANSQYGRKTNNNANRVLVEFNDPANEKILEYLNKNDFAINQKDLELSKLTFFFKSALAFVFAVALIIVALALVLIVMSINLILHKNRELILNLYNIGYSCNTIAKFYQKVVSCVTLASIGLASLLCLYIRHLYIDVLSKYFNQNDESLAIILVSSFVLLSLALIVYNYIILRSVKKIALNN
ncbi:MAG: hypothetical protein ACK5IQ_06895 [Bacteroidales bacterium]